MSICTIIIRHQYSHVKILSSTQREDEDVELLTF